MLDDEQDQDGENRVDDAILAASEDLPDKATLAAKTREEFRFSLGVNRAMQPPKSDDKAVANNGGDSVSSD